MPERRPVTKDALQGLYDSIAGVLESSDGTEAQLAVARFSPRLFGDMRSEAEMKMLMHGYSVSDRFLFGMCSAVLAFREENGGSLPALTDGQYELDREVQDAHLLASDQAAVAYFQGLEGIFHNRFPTSAALMLVQEHDLTTRLGAPPEDIKEGFKPGWYKAVMAVMPLFAENGEQAVD